MPKSNFLEDEHVAAAARIKKSHQSLSIPQAVKLTNFLTQECLCCTKQMWICCRLERNQTASQKKASNVVNHPAVISVSSTAGDGGFVSSVTLASMNETPPKKATCTRSTASAMQKIRKANKLDKEKYKKAFKHATIVYARLREKNDGMSAASVAMMISKEFDVTVSAQLIQQFVENGDIGCSPLKRDPKGNIDQRHFKNLCMAFESYVWICQLNGANRECKYKKVGLDYVPRVFGQFGEKKECSWPVTFGLNKKGGMNDKQFEAYIKNSIMPLYPDASNRPGH
jgi:hypothetical protein